MSTHLNSIRVAFVGGGGMTREHIRAFQGLPAVEVVGVTNRTREKAEAIASELGVPHVFDSIAAMKAATQANLVVMAVYEPAIRETALSVFAQDWAVLMEKPIGLDLADARAVAAAGKTRGTPVFVGLNRRHLGSTRAVLIDLSDDAGPRFIHVQDQQSLDTARAIGHSDAVVRNWMFANSIHLADYLPALGRGEIVDVQSITPWSFEKPGVVLAKIAFSSGDVGLYEAIWNGPGPWACTVSTPRRRWELRPLEKAVFQNAGERSLNPVDADPRDAAFKPGFRVQAEEVVAALRGQQSRAATLDDALVSTELVAKIYGLST